MATTSSQAVLAPSIDNEEPLIKPEINVLKRNGSLAPFQGERIKIAIEKAFKAQKKIDESEPLDAFSAREVKTISEEVIKRVLAQVTPSREIGIEQIQDLVEMLLMQAGHYSVAKGYILYREERAKARALRGEDGDEAGGSHSIMLKTGSGEEIPLDWNIVKVKLAAAVADYPNCSAEILLEEVSRSIYNHMSLEELDRALILAARTKIEREPDYQKVAAYLLLEIIYKEVLATSLSQPSFIETYRGAFEGFLRKGVSAGRLAPELLVFDANIISEALKPERDRKFLYIGLQTIYDRYLLHVDGTRIETPQFFWMRVAMGLALKEGENKEARAIEFYNMLSTFRFVSSTPTLFNAGTPHPQLSSCYLTTISDDLEHIFKSITDNAKLSKWAGGLGNDWTNVRATGSIIKGTNGASQGVVPFLKVANDTAIAVNQGGKRKGAVCAYLETWHMEIEEFLDLRKNTGDDRRRTHDMNTANWIPDLFMQRVYSNGLWTLFSPDETPDLHDLYGNAFKARYEHYEKLAEEGKIKLFKQIPAVELWRKMLSLLFETGHPWITFKDPSNIRSPQSHTGVVHSSNLCTEILLNTSADETAVCNLGSINLAEHLLPLEDKGLSYLISKGLDEEKLAETIAIAVRMLDNVIDINFYPTVEAKNSNLRHRPVGLGIMGFQDALYMIGSSYQTESAVLFADQSMEFISYHAIKASCEIAREKGCYSSYRGSKWDQGLLPIDTLQILENERGGHLEVNKESSIDWTPVRESIKKYGMRNSNVMAIAPTATIANIAGVTQSIEPTFRNLYVKSNLSGEFTIINPYLVDDLKNLSLWDDEMLDDLKYFDGVVSEITRIPQEIKAKFVTAFEIDSRWLIECASRRQKWIDMGQSLNLYIAAPSGKALDEMYKFAWERGLKTTYYLRSQGATQVEKSSMDVNKRGIQPKWMKNVSASSGIEIRREPELDLSNAASTKVCDIMDPECEACQ
ncbi:MAG TPA: ribonucleoside-diphosphate reductase subunit alpha [Oligoflexia bacterium]|nr:ribonucleoside-diphosphate reductase subunit alpha [Oligoflexia bacterium]HMP47649.1 ribonucleoside-diphosphate reductase subunit alpha [Oligoflexia bacterium]